MQIVIVPFGKQSVITNYIADLQTLVENYRVKVMTFQKNVPSLLHETEIAGYPLRLEIGMREVNEQTVTIFVRNKKTKMTVAKKDLKQTIVDLVKLYEKQL